MDWILIKLGENVGTLVQLIVLKFEHSAAKGKNTHKGKKFFAFLCVSEQFELIETHFFLNFEHSVPKGNATHKAYFFFHFYVFQSILSRLRHSFFLEISRGNNCSNEKNCV